MKIKKVVIKNALGFQETEINFGNVNLISGGNGKNKTSILDIIEKTLNNTDRREKFIRVGEDKAIIELETDDGTVVTRTVRNTLAGREESSSKVLINGLVKPAPETYLKELLGGKKELFSFNPIDFMNKKDTEQADILLEMLPIKITKELVEQWTKNVAPEIDYNRNGLVVIKDLIDIYYRFRKESNAKIAAMESQVASFSNSIPQDFKSEEWEGVKIMDLSNEIKSAMEHNQKIADAKNLIANVETKKQEIKDRYKTKQGELEVVKDKKINELTKELATKKAEIEKDINTVQAQIKELQIKLNTLVANKEELEGKAFDVASDVILVEYTQGLAELKEKEVEEIKTVEAASIQASSFLESNKEKDVAALQVAAEKAEQMKGLVPIAKQLKDAKFKLEQEQTVRDAYSECLDMFRAKPKELLTGVELPVKGMSLSEDGKVVIDGLPIKNMSTSRQITVCLDIARERAKSSPLKMICVDKIEALDEDLRKEFLTQIEADTEFQYFVTQVTKGELNIETKGGLQ